MLSFPRSSFLTHETTHGDGKGKSPHLYLSCVSGQAAGICCTAQVTSAPLQEHHQNQVSVRATAGSHPDSVQSIYFLASSHTASWALALWDERCLGSLGSLGCQLAPSASIICNQWSCKQKAFAADFCIAETLAEVSMDLLVLKRSVIFAF